MLEKNEHRARRMLVLVDQYQMRHDPGEDEEIVLSDMLADMRHLCDLHSLDYTRIVIRGGMHYLAELGDDDE